MKKYIITERSDLFEPNVYIGMVVTISGSMKKEEIKYAVEQAYTQNESAMSKVVLTENGEAYYEQMKHSGCKVFYDDRDYESILRENEKKPFDIKDGEMIRTFIIPQTSYSGEQTGFTLFIMAHHLVGDGQSILIFLQDVIDILSKRPVKYKPMELIDPKDLQKKFHMPFYQGFLPLL